MPMMFKIIILLTYLIPFTATAAMLDTDGRPRVQSYSVVDVTLSCEAQGWFVANNTVYMCTKIRDNVTIDEIHDYLVADGKVQAAKQAEIDKWYKEWIKTDEGKKWLKEYDTKMQLEKKTHK
jgi:hypothetical protein